jgi:hypothetical protein
MFIWIKNKTGIDQSVFYSIINILIGLFGTVGIIFFIAKYLTKVEQGYYYTFLSIGAIQIFFELGLSNIITQFVSFEYSKLKFLNEDELIGDEVALSRLSSLFILVKKWYSVISLALFVFLLLIGIVYFTKFKYQSDSVSWIFPWILFSISTVLNLLVTALNSFLQGFQKVALLSKLQSIPSIIKIVVICIGLKLGLGLYVLGFSQLIFSLLFFLLIFNRFKGVLKFLNDSIIIEKIDYVTEILPYQWKIALSWISGFFIFQLFTPLVFAFDGPVLAGKMGMSLAALNGIFSISMTWISTKTPIFAAMIARKNYIELDLIFISALKKSLNALFFLIFTFLFFLWLFDKYNLNILGIDIHTHFLNLEIVAILAITIVLSQFVSSWATYLRCFKKEPFLKYSLLLGILCLTGLTFSAYSFSIRGIVFTYATINLLLFPYAYYTFNKYSKLFKIS